MAISEIERPAGTSVLCETPTGDADRLRELYDRYAGELYRTAYRLTGSQADAEDVIQDFFVGLPEALRGYQGRGELGAWMRTVVARVALGKLRQRSRRREVPLEAGQEPVTAGNPEAAVDAIALQRALDSLPAALRSVLVLKELEGYSHDEIAQTLGIRIGASKTRLHRARETLRKLLRSAP